MQKSGLRCDMYANKRSSFQAKHNPSPRSARSSFSGLNKKLFSSSILPFHSAVRTANDVFLDTSCTGRARARSGSNVGPATGVSYSRRDREDPSPSLFSISQIQLQKRCLSRYHSIHIQPRRVWVILQLGGCKGLKPSRYMCRYKVSLFQRHLAHGLFVRTLFESAYP